MLDLPERLVESAALKMLDSDESGLNELKMFRSFDLILTGLLISRTALIKRRGGSEGPVSVGGGGGAGGGGGGHPDS